MMMSQRGIRIQGRMRAMQPTETQTKETGTQLLKKKRTAAADERNAPDGTSPNFLQQSHNTPTSHGSRGPHTCAIPPRSPPVPPATPPSREMFIGQLSPPSRSPPRCPLCNPLILRRVLRHCRHLQSQLAAYFNSHLLIIAFLFKFSHLALASIPVLFRPVHASKKPQHLILQEPENQTHTCCRGSHTYSYVWVAKLTVLDWNWSGNCPPEAQVEGPAIHFPSRAVKSEEIFLGLLTTE